MGFIITVILLSAALAATGTVLSLTWVRLQEANDRIEQQRLEISEQKELIDKKETFGAAMGDLITVAAGFEGVRMSGLLPLDDYEQLAKRAWFHRWSPNSLDNDTKEARAAAGELERRLAEATSQASTNATGTTYEAVIDSLGGGFVKSSMTDADSLCERDVLACVLSEDPYTVHFDAADYGLPYMTDWLRTGLAYHEFAHVLQMTNPSQTESALAAFGGDHEIMADCFALTYLDGWTLDHRIWSGSYSYWDVSLGYGHTCDEDQRQAVREWHEQLPLHVRPISQR